MQGSGATARARRGRARPAGTCRPAAAPHDKARPAGQRTGMLRMWGDRGWTPGARAAARQRAGCTGGRGPRGGRAGRACSWPRRPRRHARRCRASQAKRPASSLATASAARRSATSCRGARRVGRQGRKPSGANSMQAAGAGCGRCACAGWRPLCDERRAGSRRATAAPGPPGRGRPASASPRDSFRAALHWQLRTRTAMHMPALCLHARAAPAAACPGPTASRGRRPSRRRRPHCARGAPRRRPRRPAPPAGLSEAARAAPGRRPRARLAATSAAPAAAAGPAAGRAPSCTGFETLTRVCAPMAAHGAERAAPWRPC